MSRAEQILDVHCHVGRSGDGGVSSWEELSADLEAAGVTQAVLMPMDNRAGDAYPQQNDRILQLQQHAPDRVIGFCRVDPSEGPAAVREVERCLQRGLQGIKLHPVSDRCTTGQALDILRLAESRRIPVMIHTDHREVCHPKLWCETLARVPNLRVVLTHGGKDAYRLLPELLADLPHVMVDTSCLSYFRSRFVVEQLGPSRVVYGSDYPYSLPQLEVEKLRLLLPDAVDRASIFWQNARTWLGRDGCPDRAGM